MDSARGWLVSCGAVLSLFLGAGASAQPQTEIDDGDGAFGLGKLKWEAEQYWFREDYAALDQMFTRLANPAERFTDGRWRLVAIPLAFAHHFEVHKNWDQALWQIGEWRARNPQSVAVDIAEAIVLKRAAWSARGGTYGGSVTPEGWKLFNERLKRAEAALLRSKERSSGNPLWYDQYLEIALGLGWDQPQFRRLYDEAVAHFPDYHSYYFTMLYYLSPRWYGSVEAVDAYVREATQQTQAGQGKIMYARLYWAFAGSEGEDFALFDETGANWADMKSGFEQMMKASPQSKWNLNNFASFACRAHDGDTYRKLRKQIGDRPYGDAWPSNFSIEICDERLNKPI